MEERSGNLLAKRSAFGDFFNLVSLYCVFCVILFPCLFGSLLACLLVVCFSLASTGILSSKFVFQFIFEGEINQKNTTVTIANIMVTTESCNRDAHPLYANPGNV
jgi:glucan phosphoethanolaminetransferase (alkaline phosphatase superfamily)